MIKYSKFGILCGRKTNIIQRISLFNNNFLTKFASLHWHIFLVERFKFDSKTGWLFWTSPLHSNHFFSCEHFFKVCEQVNVAGFHRYLTWWHCLGKSVLFSSVFSWFSASNSSGRRRNDRHWFFKVVDQQNSELR